MKQPAGAVHHRVFSGAMGKAVRYRVLDKIAHGGMAEIFLALQTGAEGFQKTVVLKRILPALAADPSFVGMLVDEAHIASTLNHSNLVQVLDLGKADNQYFLVLEFVDGWSLEQVRRRAVKARLKFPLPLALYIVSSLCRGLAYVHTRKQDGKALGIVHRDVNPQNVLLSREGEVKLADFGIAKAIGKREKSATGVIKGKFAYMSPEQSIGSELDARSDLFSVGTLLYILTTGKKPFEGATDLDVLMQVRKARYDKPSELVKDFNPDVERFIARALRSDLSRRWQTAEQMADRLDAILVKLAMPSGAAVLKRWLETLEGKDGVRPPAEAAMEASRASGTVELGSRDLELEHVEAPPHEDEPPTRAREAKKRARAEAVAATRQVEDVDVIASAPDVPDAPDLPELVVAAAAALERPVPSVFARFGRWLRRMTIMTVLVLALMGTGFYFARPYLPAFIVNLLVQPAEGWVRGLVASALRAVHNLLGT
jgi:serine/threonine protein kinase